MCISSNNHHLPCFKCHPEELDCFLDFPFCSSSPFCFSSHFDSFSCEVQQSEEKDLAISWLVRNTSWPGVNLHTFLLQHVDFVWNLCQTRQYEPQNGARHSRCATPQRQTQIGTLHHHQHRLRTNLTAQRFFMFFCSVCRGLVWGK